MNKLRKALPDLLTDLSFGLFFCGISIFPVLTFYDQSPDKALRGLLLLPAALLFFLLRRVCGSFLLFAAAHIICLLGIPYGLYSITGDLIPALGALVCLLIETVYSFVRRLGKDTPGLTLPLLLAFALLYLAAAIVMDKALGLLLYFPYTVFTGISFLLFVCYTQVVNIEETLSDAYVQSAQYAKAILRFNNRSTALFVLVSAVIMGGLVLLPVSDALWALLYALRDGIRALLGMLPEGEDTPTVPIDNAEAQRGLDLSGLMPKKEPREPLIPPEVLQAIVITFLILLILFGIISFIYRMYRRFGEGVDTTGDIKEFVEPQELQFAEKARRGFRQLFERIIGPENKIRRLFYHSVRDYHKKKKQTILPSETAAEIAARMTASDEEIIELQKKYDTVRYGKNDTLS